MRHSLLFLLCPLLLAGAKPMTNDPHTALQFENPEHAAFFKRADKCIRGMFDDWRHRPFKNGGAFHNARWCRGKGARDDCQIASGTADHRDQHAVSLYTLFYGDKFPEVFGYGLQILKTPKTSGWGVNFYIAQGGKSMVGEGFHINFSHFPDASGPRDTILFAGIGESYQIAKTQTSLPAKPFAATRARLLKNAASLRDGALADLEELERKVLARITEDQVETCDFGEYQNDGIPPPCFPRKLNAEEKKEELKKAEAHFKEQKRLWLEQGELLWRALRDAVPIACLWPDSRTL
ncbi:MAG: hypothetical protein JRF33_16765 [Deltaproteobacteria bacterium]|nr:hypothetical protein [Deltaproteobacteria bacterium]